MGIKDMGQTVAKKTGALWSSAVWKTSDFVVLIYYDNKSQLPHSVDSPSYLLPR